MVDASPPTRATRLLVRLLSRIRTARSQLAVALLASVATAAITAFVRERTLSTLVVIATGIFLGSVVVLVWASLSDAILQLRAIVEAHQSRSWPESQYDRRRRHFRNEKEVLASLVVRHALPSVIDDLREGSPDADIYVLLDSGSTITPIFPRLVRGGLQPDHRGVIRIFTNNAAGYAELNQIPADEWIDPPWVPRRLSTFE